MIRLIVIREAGMDVKDTGSPATITGSEWPIANPIPVIIYANVEPITGAIAIPYAGAEFEAIAMML